MAKCQVSIKIELHVPTEHAGRKRLAKIKVVALLSPTRAWPDSAQGRGSKKRICLGKHPGANPRQFFGALPSELDAQQLITLKCGSAEEQVRNHASMG